jgi:hypothetical protein
MVQHNILGNFATKQVHFYGRRVCRILYNNSVMPMMSKIPNAQPFGRYFDINEKWNKLLLIATDSQTCTVREKNAR